MTLVLVIPLVPLLSHFVSYQNNIYGISNVNTHLIKNREWAAVAYLTNSTYGVNTKIEAAQSGKTGTGQSTTGNETGIYDMSGLSQEYVSLNGDLEKTLGSSLNETNKWYSDSNSFVTEDKPYLLRGKSSIFNYLNTDSNSNNDISFRISLLNNVRR